MAARALYAALLGALVGLERQLHSSSAGMRTYGAVSLGACAFGLVSQHAAGAPDPTRIAAQVVSGIGFLSAGIILRDVGRTTGLTTAATVWATAAIGLASAFGMFVLAALVAVVTSLLLAMHHLPSWPRPRHDDQPGRPHREHPD
jgi:putative Mg2+ transporter-C (MgtC) family protein